MSARPEPTLFEQAAYLTVLHANQYTDIRFLPERGWAALFRFMYTHAIIYGVVGSPGYEDRWCYHDEKAARSALEAWDGRWQWYEPDDHETPSVTVYEPQGWHRHPTSGRRFDEEGRLYVAR